MNEFRMFSDDISETIFAELVKQQMDRETDNICVNIDDIEVSARHTRRMERLFRNKRFENPNFYALRRVAAAIVIMFVVLASVLLMSPDIRAAVGEAIVNWFDSFVEFVGIEKEHVVDPTNWEPKVVPTGFSEIDRQMTEDFTNITFVSESGELLSFIANIDNAPLTINNEDVIYRKEQKGGIVYHLFISKNSVAMNTIVWNNAGYRFMVGADPTVSIDVLMLIAISVEKIN